jgi:hypothetical protein
MKPTISATNTGGMHASNNISCRMNALAQTTKLNRNSVAR